MVNNEKASQKSRLQVEFGILIYPYEELANRVSNPNIDEYRKAIAKVQAGDNQWRKRVHEFVTFGEVSFQNEKQEIFRELISLNADIRNLIRKYSTQKDIADLHNKFKQRFNSAKLEIIQSIDKIPIDWQAVLFKANTPFTTYLCILDCIKSARHRIYYFDSYLTTHFFQLYLREIDKSISIRLITTKGKNDYGISNVTQVSNLFRKEFTDYKLIEVEPNALHDRNLIIDDNIFTLGPSINQIGIKPTNFGPVDNKQEAETTLNNILEKGNVIHES